MASEFMIQVRVAIRLRHYSKRTEQTYIYWIKKFILFHSKQHPPTMNEFHIEAFLSHLAIDKHVSPSTQNTALNALTFMYREVLKIELGKYDQFVRAKPKKKLPVFLTHSEIQQLFLQLEGHHKVAASLMYGSGLRLMETVRLRVKDIDFNHSCLRIIDGKGGKDRICSIVFYVRNL